MNDIRSFAIPAMISLLGFLFITCNDNALLPGSLDDLEIRFLSGTISASLMPFIPPDPIFCQLVVLAKNKSSTSPLASLRIQEADVFLDSTDARLGTISFATAWDGHLSPGEEDTVHLAKVRSPVSLFMPPCRQRIYLNLKVNALLTVSKTFQTDTLRFSCVY
jgi:hypothetical protein